MSDRKRSANWLVQEKMLLLDLVTDHFRIIDNKKTDSVSVKQKNAEWVKMSDEFNSQTTGVHRTAENLKAQWESLKKITKKAASSARQSLLQTGGEPAKPQNNDPVHNKILGLLSSSAVGTVNHFDKDNVIFTIIQETSETCSSKGEPEIEKVSVPGEPNISISSHSSPGISVVLENMDSMPMINRNWGDNTPGMLEKPVSSSLRFHNDETSVCMLPEDVMGNKTPKPKAEPWASKRYPTQPRTSSSAMEEYHKTKIKAMEIQMNFAEIEREEANKMFELNYETQKDILKQEKLKTRLLRIQIINAKREGKRK